MNPYLDLFWHYIGRWIVGALGVAIIASVLIVVVAALWWLFLPLFLLGIGVFFVSLAID